MPRRMDRPGSAKILAVVKTRLLEPADTSTTMAVAVDVAVLTGIYAFLIHLFPAALMFAPTVTAGGDTPSHFVAARYLVDHLLPKGRISGWFPGQLAGFPLLQNYFPLPFLLMAALSLLLPLTVAFKLVTVTGIFLLPLCTYLFLRCLGQAFPVPVIGAVASLTFLFIESHSMWGGNILSTLAGTFCYSIGMALFILWLGLIYRALTRKKGYLGCGLLLAAVGMCHGYALLTAGVGSLFFVLFFKPVKESLRVLLLIHLTAFCLMAFWLVPLLANLPYTTPFNIVWQFDDWQAFVRQIIPPVAFPCWVLFLVATAFHWRQRVRQPSSIDLRPLGYLWFVSLCAIMFYAMGHRIGVVDVRFLPFLQLMWVVGGALCFQQRPISLAAKSVLALVLLIGTLFWIDARETQIRDWVGWNYSGLESKSLHIPYDLVNRYLSGSHSAPRVVYEHSSLNNGAGSVRAFESLPHFSGRSTLEGLYFQAALTAPFVYYIQSEISQSPSMPFSQYLYSRFNPERAAAHLKLFNVGHLIAVEPRTRDALRASSAYTSDRRIEPYEIFKVRGNSGRYVEPVRFKPVLLAAGAWRETAYRWFRKSDLKVPLVFQRRIGTEELNRFIVRPSPEMADLPKIPLKPPPVKPRVTVDRDEILIEQAPIGHPLWIKVAYHPNWRVTGADKLYLASPAFMLVYPSAETVHIYYGRRWPEYLGLAMTFAALFFIGVSRLGAKWNLIRAVGRGFRKYGHIPALILMGLVLTGIAYRFVAAISAPPARIFHQGLKHQAAGSVDTARLSFQAVLNQYAQTQVADRAALQYALTFYQTRDWPRAIEAFRNLIRRYPESRQMGQALYHLGLCHLKAGNFSDARENFRQTAERFPDEAWARFATDKLNATKWKR